MVDPIQKIRSKPDRKAFLCPDCLFRTHFLAAKTGNAAFFQIDQGFSSGNPNDFFRAGGRAFTAAHATVFFHRRVWRAILF